MTWIQTYTGKKFFPLTPNVKDVCIEDIAHALAMKCRFNGHCREFYSIAQHCVLVSEALPAWCALQGLLHDATEAYLPDVASPIKNQFRCIDPSCEGHRQFNAIECGLMCCIAEALKVPIPFPQLVADMDAVLLATEKRDLMAPEPEAWAPLPEPLSATIYTWAPGMAEQRFMKRWKQLQRRLETVS